VTITPDHSAGRADPRGPGIREVRLEITVEHPHPVSEFTACSTFRKMPFDIGPLVKDTVRTGDVELYRMFVKVDHQSLLSYNSISVLKRSPRVI
jgi:hypothetical protein